MFEYLEPDASDDSGSGSLPLPPRSGANNKETRSLNPEKVRHMLYGSLAGIDRTIKILHAHGYSDPNDGRAPIPVPPTSDIPGTAAREAGMWMAFAKRSVSESPPKPC